jgi:hypothetical protein
VRLATKFATIADNTTNIFFLKNALWISKNAELKGTVA